MFGSSFFERYIKRMIISRSFVLFVFIVTTIAIGLIVYGSFVSDKFIGDDSVNIEISRELISPIGSRYVVFATFALNYLLSGYDPSSYYLLNIIVHIVNSFLLCVLMVMLFKTQCHADNVAAENNQIFVSCLFALVFLVHPINNTTVYIISCRFISIATTFFLISCVCYIKARLNMINEKNYALYLTLSFFSCVLAMKCKETSFVLPFVIVLAEFLLFYEKKPKIVYVYLAFYVAALSIIPISYLSGYGDIFDHTGRFRGTSTLEGQTSVISSYTYFSTQMRVITGYWLDLLYPVNIVMSKHYRLSSSLFELNTFLSFCFVSLVFMASIVMLFLCRIKKLLTLSLVAFGMMWMFIALSIESSVIPIEDIHNHHRFYLPSIGLYVVISTITNKLFEINKKLKFFMVLSISVLILVLSFMSYGNHVKYKSNSAIWGYSLLADPENPRAAFYFGIHLVRNGFCREGIPLIKAAENSTDENFVNLLRSRPRQILATKEAYFMCGVAPNKNNYVSIPMSDYRRFLEYIPSQPKK